MTRILSALAFGSMLAVSCSAGTIYFQGFETDTSGWYPDTGSGTTDGTITKVPNGGGTLALTAPDGSNYAEVTNSPDSYLRGYGTGGYSVFGFASGIPAYPGSPFTQSIDVYIDRSLTSGGQQGFWIDDAPSSTSADDAGSGGISYGAEHNFRLAYNGTNVAVTVDGDLLPLYTIATSGWYDFQFTYSKSSAVATDLSNTTLTLATPDGTGLASTTRVNNFTGTGVTPLQNQYLAGPGYTWLPVWQNGFSNNTLGIDDVQAFTAAPEPASFLLFGGAFGALALTVRRKRV